MDGASTGIVKERRRGRDPSGAGIQHVDRNCHQPHHYGLMLSGAHVTYLDAYPLNEYSMYGAVPVRAIRSVLLNLREAGKLNRVKILMLTNCTFDGVVYDVEKVMEERLRDAIDNHPLLSKYMRCLRIVDMIPLEFRESKIDQPLRTGLDNMITAWDTDEFVLDPSRSACTSVRQGSTARRSSAST
jgi:arginine/lysine/ornithine decarboxylase